MVRTVWMRLGPIFVMAAGRPSSNLRFMRIGTRRAPVALRLCQPSREIPLLSKEQRFVSRGRRHAFGVAGAGQRD